MGQQLSEWDKGLTEFRVSRAAGPSAVGLELTVGRHHVGFRGLCSVGAGMRASELQEGDAGSESLGAAEVSV